MTDPSIRLDQPDFARMALLCPDGPALIEVRHLDELLEVTLEGAGAEWFVQFLPNLLGIHFRPPEFDGPRVLQRALKRYEGMRLPVAPLLFPRLVQVVLQQLISFRDAAKGWRDLLRRHGTPMADDMIAPPTARVLARMASHEYVECNILPQHGRRISGLARHVRKIEDRWGQGVRPESREETLQLLAKLPGIGPWTIGFLSGSSMGDGDAVMPGDYSLPSQVAHFFEGKDQGTDETMLKTLEPFRPNRFYVLSLIIRASSGPPRKGPRTRPISHNFRSPRSRG